MNTKILIVDDSALIRNQVRRALGVAGFEIFDAADGLIALEMLRSHGPMKLVVCDVNMPRMDGLQFLEALRADAALAATPVVMLTTEAHIDLIERAKKLGVKGWIVKPFKPDLLLSAARRLTES